jgi:hypothetical protein
MINIQSWEMFNEAKFNGDIKEIDIDSINPQKKDIQRADGLDWLRNSHYGTGAPFTAAASKQAKSIKDPIKLIRRAKAVIMRWGSGDHIGVSAGVEKIENAWEPFHDALKKFGFTASQIKKIEELKYLKKKIK